MQKESMGCRRCWGAFADAMLTSSEAETFVRAYARTVRNPDGPDRGLTRATCNLGAVVSAELLLRGAPGCAQRPCEDIRARMERMIETRAWLMGV